MSVAVPVAYVPHVLAVYRVHDQSVSASLTKLGVTLRETADTIRKHNHLRQRMLPTEALTKALQIRTEIAFEQARAFRRAGEYESGRALIAAGLYCDSSIKTRLRAAWLRFRGIEHSTRRRFATLAKAITRCL
jgi:hypothetical protein